MLKTVDLQPATSQADYHSCMGMMALLGATCAFGTLPLTQAVGVLHCALRMGKFRIYLGSNDKPSAALLWAHLGPEATDTYIKKGYLPDIADWNSGPDLWFLNVIAEDGKIRAVIDDVRQSEMFKDNDRAFMLRVGPTGTRRVLCFTRRGLQSIRTLKRPGTDASDQT